jgi:hypothetical protein
MIKKGITWLITYYNNYIHTFDILFLFSPIFSSVDKNNSIYCLVGVIEHCGGPFINAEHYVDYVRARKTGNQQQ